MSSVVDELPTVGYPTVILSGKTLPKSNKFINNDENFVRQVTERLEESEVVHGNVRSGAPIIIYFGQHQSSLRTALIDNLKHEDMTLILFSIEEYLWQWLDLNPSLTVASLILQSTLHIQELIARIHTYNSVQSILVRCVTTELTALQRFSRSYARVDGIFDDDTRLLIKLLFDLILFSEELADQQSEDESNQMEVQRNYNRALRFCALVKTI